MTSCKLTPFEVSLKLFQLQESILYPPCFPETNKLLCSFYSVILLLIELTPQFILMVRARGVKKK